MNNKALIILKLYCYVYIIAMTSADCVNDKKRD